VFFRGPPLGFSTSFRVFSPKAHSRGRSGPQLFCRVPSSFAWTPPFSTTWIFSSFFFRLLRLPCRPGNRFEV